MINRRIRRSVYEPSWDAPTASSSKVRLSRPIIPKPRCAAGGEACDLIIPKTAQKLGSSCFFMRAHTRINFDNIDRAAGQAVAMAKKIG